LKTIKDLLLLLILSLILIFGVLELVQYINDINFNQEFYTVLSSVSSSIASVGGLLLLVVTFLYLLVTRKMAVETTKQRKLLEEPAVSLKIIPDNKDPNFLFFVLKNTGGGAAYDISIVFNPDLNYRASSLNKLKMFNNMPLLDKGEEIKFFFDSAIQFFKSDAPTETTVTITYFNTPKINKGSKPIKREIIIDFEERKGLLYLNRRDVHDLVNEVEELKHALLISTIEKKGE
jgi:hypothetical protein